jgi:TolB protein
MKALFSILSKSLSLLHLIVIGIPIFSYGQESFDLSLEAPSLTNISQVTFPEMGFDRAGEAYFSPDSQTILFQAIPRGLEHYQIYKMDLNNLNPVMVSTGKGACTCAYFRPDSKKIIFASSHSDPILRDALLKKAYKWDLTPYMNIYEGDPDGSNLVPLTSGPAYHAECAYSSDGSKIVYASNETGSMNIYTMNSDGSNVQQITHTDYCYNGGPFFSPDGSKIIFRADREIPNYLQIFVINSDGTDEKQLTFNNAVNWAPYWHPNGKVIAYTTSLHGHQHYEIYLMNIETGKQCRLTHHSGFDGLPVFNSEGTKFMWTSKRGLSGNCQVFIADFQLPNQLQED